MSISNIDSLGSRLIFDDCKVKFNPKLYDLTGIFRNGIHFRKLKIKDYEQYLDILSQLTHVGDISLEKFTERLCEINRSNSNIFIYVISNEDINEIIAAGTLIIEPKFIHNCSKLGHVEDIVVNKKYRGKGYGKMMINRLVGIAQEEKCYKVRLVCSDKNIGFYEKCNFEKSGVEMIKRFKL